MPTETKSGVSLWVAATCLVLLVSAAFFLGRQFREPASPSVPVLQHGKPIVAMVPGSVMTDIYAHNLRLHQGPDFRVYIQWLRGQLQPARKGVVPSFDDPESFYLNITNGVMRVNLGDINNYLNAKSAEAPLRNIRMSGNGEQVRITGTLHKIIPIPIEVKGIIKAGSESRIQIHVTKINVLKLPFKALLGVLHITLQDFMKSGQVKGVDVDGNDIYFDPQLLLPPPHIRGLVTKFSVGDPDVEAVYGDATKDVARTEQWRNFLRLQHGSLAFGKLVMNDVDLTMVDISQDSWFDLDLANYQAQLVKGYTRITPQQGLQIFMPDATELQKGVKETSIPWLKNRNVAAPAEVVPKK